MKAGLSPTGQALRALELLEDQPGIPTEPSGEPYRGYRAGRSIPLPPLVFTPAEALDFVMAGLDGSHEPREIAAAMRGRVSRRDTSCPRA
jgi:hypothetical protein